MNDQLEALYRDRHSRRDAMSPHMPTLRKLAAECSVAVEFGVRRANSTVALLSGNDHIKVYSYDVENHRQAQPIYRSIRQAVGDRWTFTIHDSVTAEVPKCDLLLHDSLHSYDHVRRELKFHGHKVAKYLVFHDTVTMGEHGQAFQSNDPDPNIIGILPAIRRYQKMNPRWKTIIDHKHSNGLMVLAKQ